ncbi:MAG: hypothetical protein QM756_21330 [Polyangiaceae bacterium]
MSTPSAALIDSGDFEAVLEAELVDEPIRHDEAAMIEASLAASVAASAEFRVEPTRASGNSGVRPSPALLAVRIEAAMAASARTEATLTDLLRTAKFLSASIHAVRDANAALVEELEVLCAVVDGDHAERNALERRIQRLERVADDTGREAAKERQFLLEEHDAFIASLVSDHERELKELRRRLASLETEPAATEK